MVPVETTEATSALVTVYCVYLVVGGGLIFWLARTLSNHGAVFLADVFEDRKEVATAVNKLLVIGFYLLNGGYALVLMRSIEATTTLEAFRALATYLGILLLTLGVVHFINMRVFFSIRNRVSKDRQEQALRQERQAWYPQQQYPQEQYPQHQYQAAPHNA